MSHYRLKTKELELTYTATRAKDREAKGLDNRASKAKNREPQPYENPSLIWKKMIGLINPCKFSWSTEQCDNVCILQQRKRNNNNKNYDFYKFIFKNLIFVLKYYLFCHFVVFLLENRKFLPQRSREQGRIIIGGDSCQSSLLKNGVAHPVPWKHWSYVAHGFTVTEISLSASRNAGEISLSCLNIWNKEDSLAETCFSGWEISYYYLIFSWVKNKRNLVGKTLWFSLSQRSKTFVHTFKKRAN